MAESMRDESDDDSGSAAKLISIHAVDPGTGFGGEDYEPWLFQTMLNELSERELGVGFIYSILELFATRHSLTDVAVVLVNESFGTQMFRLGGEAVTPEMAAHLNASPGVYCEPDTVPSANVTPCALRASWRCPCTSRASVPLTTRSPTLRIAAASMRPRSFGRAQRSLRLGVHAGPSGSE